MTAELVKVVFVARESLPGEQAQDINTPESLILIGKSCALSATDARVQSEYFAAFWRQHGW